jgi:hypothetical protein
MWKTKKQKIKEVEQRLDGETTKLLKRNYSLDRWTLIIEEYRVFERFGVGKIIERKCTTGITIYKPSEWLYFISCITGVNLDRIRWFLEEKGL